MLAIAATPLAAQERVSLSPEASLAVEQQDDSKTAQLLAVETRRCEQARPVADECLVLHFRLAEALFYLERWMEAEAAMASAIRSLETAANPPVDDRINVYSLAGDITSQQGKMAQSIDFRLAELAARREAPAPDRMGIARTTNRIATAYYTLSRFDLALPFASETVVIFKEVLGANDKNLAVGYANYADNLLKLGRKDEAKANYEAALRIYRTHSDMAEQATRLEALIADIDGVPAPPPTRVARPRPALVDGRWPLPDGLEAFETSGDVQGYLSLLLDEYDACDAAYGEAVQCLDLIEKIGTGAFSANLLDIGLEFAQRAARIAERDLPPGDPAHVRAALQVGMAYWNAYDFTAAIPPLQRVVAASNAVEAIGQVQVDAARYALASAFDFEGRYDEAEAAYRAMLDAQLARDPDDAESLAGAYEGIGNAQVGRKDFAAAAASFGEAIAMQKRADPDNILAISLMHRQQARALASAFRFAESAAVLRQLIAYLELRSPDDERLPAVWNDYALKLQELGEFGEAEAGLRKSIAIGAVNPETRPSEQASTYYNLGQLLLDQARPAEAEQAMRQSLALRDQDNADAQYARGLLGLGTALAGQRRFDEALGLFAQGLKIAEAENADVAAELLGNTGFVLRELGRFDEAIGYYERAAALLEADMPETGPVLSAAYENIGSILFRQQRYAEAQPYLERSLALRQDIYGAESPQTALTLNDMAYNLAGLGRFAEADNAMLRSFRIRMSFRAPPHPEYIDANGNLGLFLKDSNTPLARTLLIRAEEALLQLLASYTDFNEQANDQMKRYRDMFTGRVETAWKLSRQR